MNAFNTEDVLKQSVNPTVPIAFNTDRTNPNLDLNTVRTLGDDEKANTVTSRVKDGSNSNGGASSSNTPIDYKFSTPASQSLSKGRVNSFTGTFGLGSGPIDKENANYIDVSGAIVGERQNNFGTLAQIATNIDNPVKTTPVFEMADLKTQHPKSDNRR